MEDKLLRVIHEKKEGRTKQLGEIMGITTAYAGKMRKKLVNEGYIELIGQGKSFKCHLTIRGLQRLGLNPNSYKPLRNENIPTGVTNTELVKDRRMSVLAYLTFGFNNIVISQLLEESTAVISNDLKHLRNQKMLKDRSLTQKGRKTLYNYPCDIW